MADADDSIRAGGTELRDYFRILWSRKWTVAVVLLIVVAAAMVLSFRQTPVYSSESKVLVPQPVGSVDQSGRVQAGQAEPDVEAEVATSEPVAEQVIEALRLQADASEVLAAIEVAPVRGTSSVLLFTAESPDPQQAADLAHEFANQYMIYRRLQYAADLQTELTSVNAALKSVNTRLRRARADDPGRASLLSERSALNSRRSALVLGIEQVRETGGDILVDARVPSTPSRPNHARSALFAIVIGLMLGIAAAFLRDYVDDRLRGTGDVEEQLGGVVLGAVPQVEKGKRRKRKGGGLQATEEDLIVIRDPHASATESYRTLRTNLTFLAARGTLKRLLVTSPGKGEGKSTTAANLAVVLAQTGQRVLLLDADLRRPTIHRLFGVPLQPGLSGVLAGQSALETAVRNPGIPGLRLVTAGTVPPNPVELLSSPNLADLLEQIAAATDWLIMDAPPALGLADASVLSVHADGVLLVVHGDTGRRELRNARSQLRKVGANIVGAVLNAFGSAAASYYADRYHPQEAEGLARATGAEPRPRKEKRRSRRKGAEQSREPESGLGQGTPAGGSPGGTRREADGPGTRDGETAAAAASAQGENAQGQSAPPPPDELFLS